MLFKHVNTGEKAVGPFGKDTIVVDVILMDIDLGSEVDTEHSGWNIRDKRYACRFVIAHQAWDSWKNWRITSYGYVVKNSGIYIVLDASIKMAIKLFDAKVKEQTKCARAAFGK